MSTDAMRTQMETGKGFIAALDQSGGSTPKALRLYGIPEDAYGSEAEMFDLIHAMRARIATAPAFTGAKVIGAILFEMTMDREIGGKPSARYLWEDKGVVPFLKIDKGLEAEANGVQLMKQIPGLSALLDRAAAAGIFGTKERSVINAANAGGIADVVAQQVDLGLEVLDKGLVPILEPEVNIKAPDKAVAEEILLAELLKGLEAVPEGQKVMLKLSIPSRAGLYAPLIAHSKVLRVVALSGGYSREEACARLAENHGMIASFSRALTEGLSAQQSDAEFDTALAAAIDAIHAASVA
ncbi:fructose bisphosphate aldolase [Roseicyclus persicicus]|uniref:fructose-bisphosphate aldolase n=1 Tax=Roseicyclus persicicus TaxID=2650661 RepID=A0A7X6H1S2_9RHOB|nr:fructose bisphosphate aldolase [Roseibacterium persicicum]NKX46355.1 fructose bisphosphate aldolase [Roseibacterium persicicum]